MIRYVFLLIAALSAWNVSADDLTNAVATAATVPAKDYKFYEMRTYHAADGKLADLRARFLHFTDKLLVKHGMEIAGSWMPVDKDGEPTGTLIYILAFPSRAARDKDWKEFSRDIEWLAIKTDTEIDGKLIARVDSVFMAPNEVPPAATAVTPP